MTAISSKVRPGREKRTTAASLIILNSKMEEAPAVRAWRENQWTNRLILSFNQLKRSLATGLMIWAVSSSRTCPRGSSIWTLTTKINSFKRSTINHIFDVRPLINDYKEQPIPRSRCSKKEMDAALTLQGQPYKQVDQGCMIVMIATRSFIKRIWLK